MTPATWRRRARNGAAALDMVTAAIHVTTGDVVMDWTMTDQCGDDYHLWDGYGSYTLVMAPPFW